MIPYRLRLRLLAHRHVRPAFGRGRTGARRSCDTRYSKETRHDRDDRTLSTSKTPKSRRHRASRTDRSYAPARQRMS